MICGICLTAGECNCLFNNFVSNRDESKVLHMNCIYCGEVHYNFDCPNDEVNDEFHKTQIYATSPEAEFEEWWNKLGGFEMYKFQGVTHTFFKSIWMASRGLK